MLPSVDVVRRALVAPQELCRARRSPWPTTLPSIRGCRMMSTLTIAGPRARKKRRRCAGRTPSRAERANRCSRHGRIGRLLAAVCLPLHHIAIDGLARRETLVAGLEPASIAIVRRVDFGRSGVRRCAFADCAARRSPRIRPANIHKQFRRVSMVVSLVPASPVRPASLDCLAVCGATPT